MRSASNTGRPVFTRAELVLDARPCVEHDVAAITGEIYEHISYDAR